MTADHMGNTPITWALTTLAVQTRGYSLCSAADEHCVCFTVVNVKISPSTGIAPSARVAALVYCSTTLPVTDHCRFCPLDGFMLANSLQSMLGVDLCARCA
jgi:hypothetical protein